MGLPYFITAYPRPFPEGQAFLMTRDLSHEEERKRETGKIACGDGQKRQSKNEKQGRGKMKRAGRRLVVEEKNISHGQ